MASIHTTRISLSPSSSNSNPNPKFASRTSAFFSYSPRPNVHPLRKHHYQHNHHQFRSTPCRCKKHDSGGESGGIRWNMILHDALRGAVKRCLEYLIPYWESHCKAVEEKLEGLLEEDLKSNEKLTAEEKKLFPQREEKKQDLEWSWERWKQHICEIEENERVLQALKLQLRTAVVMEDFNSAERLKQAISIARKYDSVGRAISDLNRAIEEERYADAANIRDHAGAALVGWWAGLSENVSDPHGLIVRITAEYGRYTAKSYSSRQLTSSSPGVPLFEVYFTKTNGELKQQAVYIKPGNTKSSEFDDVDLTTNVGDILLSDSLFDDEKDDTEENDDEFDISELENLAEEESGSDIEVEMAYSSNSSRSEGEKVSHSLVPARMERKDRFSFTLRIDNDEKPKEDSGTRQLKKKKAAVISVQHGTDLVLPDLAKLGSGKKEISVKIIITDIKLSRKKSSQQLLPGATHFRRIMTPTSSDPLGGLYVAASGMGSDILCLQRKFGQWKEDDASGNKERDLEFYEYVEAIKLTGDHLVPAGQVMFRAKIGKQHQLPHKGLIPKELGVVARYKGQGCISGADVGFKSPQWVEGELLVLDSKFITDGPVIGFFYWVSNFHIVEFFSRLILPD